MVVVLRPKQLATAGRGQMFGSASGSLCFLGTWPNYQTSSKWNSEHNKVAKASTFGGKHSTFLVYLAAPHGLYEVPALALVQLHRDREGSCPE